MEYDEILLEIDSFGTIGENWNGYGGVQPLGVTIELCKKIIETLSIKQIKDIDYTCPCPHGTVTISFETSKGLLSLEIGKDSMGYFVEIEGADVEYRDDLYLSSDSHFETSMRIFNQDYKLIETFE